MPGRKRLKQEVSSYHAERIERQAALLQIAIRDASIGMSPFCPHGEALGQLLKDLRTAVNIVNNLPADYHRPNMHMSPGQLAWHNDVERKAKASRKEEIDDTDYDQSTDSSD